MSSPDIRAALERLLHDLIEGKVLDGAIADADAALVAEPVAVSERLPGPEDVSEDGNCWLWDREGCFWDWTYIRTRTRAEMYTYTHWLPAHAIPLPQVGEVPNV